MTTNDKYGVLLMNLGTPELPTAHAVKKFLAEFLQDKRVVDTNRLLWYPLLHCIVLPKRSAKVAKLYEKIWLDEGSPLLVHTQKQAQKLSLMLAEQAVVNIAMTYGAPDLLLALNDFKRQKITNVIVLPLYPQYSTTTTAPAFDALERALIKSKTLFNIIKIASYYDHPLYIKALAHSVRISWQKYGQSDYLLCSYHGIPKRYANNGDVYPDHCKRTTQLLGQELGLSVEQIGIAYQSRFGKEEWLQPYTDQILQDLPQQGIKKLSIITPAFASDCLETLEEIALEARDLFLSAGGSYYQYIPCLNDGDEHIKLLNDLVKGAI